MEAAGFDHGAEVVIGCLLAISVVIGAVLARCLLNRNADTETKQARKALANVLNDGTRSKSTNKKTTEDDMFDVPLNDERSYQGIDLNAEDALTSETSYTKAPSKPSRKSTRVTASKKQ